MKTGKGKCGCLWFVALGPFLPFSQRIGAVVARRIVHGNKGCEDSNMRIDSVRMKSGTHVYKADVIDLTTVYMIPLLRA